MLLRPLSDDDDRTNFTCGDAALDDFFRMRAGQNQFKHRTSVTYVLADGRELGGFVTVLPGTVRRVDLGIAHRRLPPGALPVLVIARMGVATSRQRQGLGARLLAGALDVALELVDRVGVRRRRRRRERRRVLVLRALRFRVASDRRRPGSPTRLPAHSDDPTRA